MEKYSIRLTALVLLLASGVFVLLAYGAHVSFNEIPSTGLWITAGLLFILAADAWKSTTKSEESHD